MKICLLNKKGGSGKTTVAALLFMALRQAGHCVAATDRDPQGTLSRFLATNNLPLDPNPVVEIVDTPPRLDADVLDAAANADIILIPARPGIGDVWAVQDTVQVLQGRGLLAKSRLVWNAVRPGTILAKQLPAFEGAAQIQSLKASLTLREAYIHALAVGWSALDKTCREEVSALALSAFAIR